MERSSLPNLHAVIASRRSASRGSRSSGRGFTLVELMIVVAIVGVLAILAVVGFSKLIGSSRTTEAMSNVNAIKIAQEAYHSETGVYANVSTSLCDTPSCSALYPQESVSKPVGNYKVGWGVACGAACNTGYEWSALGTHITGGVMYGYSTIAGAAGVAPTGLPTAWPSGYTVTIPTPPADWYLVTGVGDENGDGVACVVLGSSLTNDLMVMNEGE